MLIFSLENKSLLRLTNGNCQVAMQLRLHAAIIKDVRALGVRSARSVASLAPTLRIDRESGHP